MDAAVIHECTRLAFADRMSFPETVKRLLEIGVERYYADLLLLRKTSYAGDGGSHEETLPLAEPPLIGSSFAAEQVKEAIHAIQQRHIDYPTFLRQIMRAGAVGYCVFLHGKRALYLGRNGDCHVEHFPAAK